MTADVCPVSPEPVIVALARRASDDQRRSAVRNQHCARTLARVGGAHAGEADVQVVMVPTDVAQDASAGVPAAGILHHLGQERVVVAQLLQVGV